MLNEKHKTNNIDTIILSGGSLYGIVYISVFKFLYDNNLYSNIKNYYGVSIGSLACLIMLLNYSYDEMIELFCDKIAITDIIKVDLSKIFKIVKDFGINDGIELENLTKYILENKGLSPYITLSQLFEYTNKYYYIGVSSLLNNKYELFDHINNPNLPVWLAIRMSCSIPLFFTPIKYNNNYYVDGGLINNNPVNLVIEKCLTEDKCFIINTDTTDTIEVSNTDTIEVSNTDTIEVNNNSTIHEKNEELSDKLYNFNFICIRLETDNDKFNNDNISLIDYLKLVMRQIFTNQHYRREKYEKYILKLNCYEYGDIIFNTKMIKGLKKQKILYILDEIYLKFEKEFSEKLLCYTSKK